MSVSKSPKRLNPSSDSDDCPLRAVKLQRSAQAWAPPGHSSRDSHNYTPSPGKWLPVLLEQVMLQMGQTGPAPAGTWCSTLSSIISAETMPKENLDEVTLKDDIEKQTSLVPNLGNALQFEMSQVSRLERERDVALVVVQRMEKELERMRKDARDDRVKLEEQTLASLTAMDTEQQKLILEHAKLNKEKAALQCELEIAQTAVRAGKAKCDILIANAELEKRKAEDNRAFVEAEKEAATTALAQEKDEIVRLCNFIVKMASTIRQPQSEKSKLPDQVSIMQTEVADPKNKMESHKAALEQSEVERRKLAEDLLLTQKDASEKQRKMDESHKTALQITQNECRALENSLVELKRDKGNVADQLSMMQEEVDKAKEEVKLHKTALEQSEASSKARWESLKRAREDSRTLKDDLKRDQKKLADKLSMMQKEVDKAKAEVKLHKTALEQSEANCKALANYLLVIEKSSKEQQERTMLEVYKTRMNCQKDLEGRTRVMEQKRIESETECAAAQKELLEVKDSTLCQICFESPKDTMCMPCLHFQYCSTCLDQHKRRSRTCPACRTSLSGTLKSEILT